MGFEEITIGKINSPDVFYFVPVHENYDVYKKQVREMNEFFNLKEERSGQKYPWTIKSMKYPKFIRRLKLSNVITCAAGYSEWKVLAHVIVQALVGNTSECKTYAVFDRIDNRTYHGDLVIKMKNEFRKKTFLEDTLRKEPKPRGNFFSLRKIYLHEGLVIAANHDGFNTLDEEPVETPMKSPIILPKLDLREMIEKEKKKQKSSLVKDDLRHLTEEEKKNSTFSEIDMNHDDDKPKKKSIFLGTDLKYLNELQIDASETPRLLEFFSCQSDKEFNFQDSKLDITSDFPEQKSLVPGADLRQLINGLKLKPSEDLKLDHSLKSNSEFEIYSENRDIKPNHQAEFVSKSFDRFDEEISENSIFKNMSREEKLESLKAVLSDDFYKPQVNSKEKEIGSKGVLEWPETELKKDDFETSSKHGEMKNNTVDFEAKITLKNSTVQVHKKLKAKSSPLRYFLDRDRQEQELAAKNAEFEEKMEKLTSKNGKPKVKYSPLRYFLEKDRKEKEVAAKNAEFERCHTNVKFEGKTQTKIRFNIDKAEEMSSIDEDKIISGFDLQNTGKRKEFLSKINRKKERRRTFRD